MSQRGWFLHATGSALNRMLSEEAVELEKYLPKRSSVTLATLRVQTACIHLYECVHKGLLASLVAGEEPGRERPSSTWGMRRLSLPPWWERGTYGRCGVRAAQA